MQNAEHPAGARMRNAKGGVGQFRIPNSGTLWVFRNRG